MFKDIYQKKGYESRLLSRTTEDSVTVTSVLIPWNTCGMTQATILGVATLTYLPYCFFNLISPLMSITVAAIGYKIKRINEKLKVSLLTKVVIAIAAGVLFGQFLPNGIARIFVTFNSLFGNFLSFSIPLIILGLVTPAIGDLGKGAGKLLAITALIAYGSTIFSGFFTFFSSSAIFPHILPVNTELTAMENPEDFMLTPYFTVGMPPLMDVMTALLLSFTIGLGLSYINGNVLREGFNDFQKIIIKLIEAVIIPLLPLHIFGIFLNMTVSGQVMSIIAMFLKVIIVIFVLHVLLLIIQFTIAGSISGKIHFGY